MAIKTEAIVLRERELQDADRLYELLTPREGVILARARGVGKPHSHLAGHLQQFARVKVMLGRGAFDHVAGVATIDSNQLLRDDWYTYILASALVELVLKVQTRGVPAYDEYALLKSAFERVQQPATSQSEKALIARTFLWKLLALSGWRPNLNECVNCYRALVGEVWYERGKGFICDAHGKNGILVTQSVRSIISDAVTTAGWDTVLGHERSAELQRSWLSLTQQYYQDVIESPLQSLTSFEFNVQE